MACATNSAATLKSGDLAAARDVQFQVESYLHHQGRSFSQRFDANTYLLMTRALDHFDPARDFDDDLVAALKRAQSDFLVLSFTTDWRFAPARSKEIVDALIAARKNVVSAVIDTPHGHDAFLLQVPRYFSVLSAYLLTRRRTSERVMRPDISIIADLVTADSRVLDLGCGDGELLAHLRRTKGVNGYGLEIDPEMITSCITAGVNVIEQDLDQGLTNFPSDSFDLVVMTDTLQSVKRPDVMLDEMLRIGRECIVTFPNFAHWRCRLLSRFARPDACGETPAASVVRHAEHPSVHVRRLRGAVRNETPPPSPTSRSRLPAPRRRPVCSPAATHRRCCSHVKWRASAPMAAPR